jgi:hypothetical protein
MTHDLAAFVAALKAGGDLEPYAPWIERKFGRSFKDPARFVAARDRFILTTYREKVLGKRTGWPWERIFELLKPRFPNPEYAKNIATGKIFARDGRALYEALDDDQRDAVHTRLTKSPSKN